MKKILKFLTVSVFFLVFSFSAQAALLKNNDKMIDQAQYTASEAGFADLSDGQNTPLGVIIASVIRTALLLLSIIFIVLIIISGYQWMTAGGNEKTVTEAQARLKNAVIGLIVVLAAYAIATFVLSRIGTATGVNLNPNNSQQGSGSGNTSNTGGSGGSGSGTINP
jgi:hypothetical protein